MRKIFVILLSLSLLASCKSEDTLLSDRDKIVKYLTTTRRMIAEESLGEVIEEEPSFYSTFGRYAYRHIVNYYDEGRESRPQIEWGDKLELRFNAYTFTGTEPKNKENLYWSNIPEVIAQLGSSSGNTLDWSTEPLFIELGKTDILDGLELTLPGCYEADSIQVYMTSELAYGKALIGSVPKNSMVAWYIKVEKVTKK